MLDYQPGDAISENALSKEFGLSRSPLREILLKLEWEKLVRSVPNSGRIVSEINFEQLMNIYRIRLSIEGLVGMLAAENRLEMHLQELEKIIVECDKLKGHKKNIKALVKISFRFRDILHEATGNKELTFISEYLFNLTHRIFYLVAAKGDWSKEVSILYKEIKDTHDILLKGDPEGTYILRQKTLESYIDRIKNLL